MIVALRYEEMSRNGSEVGEGEGVALVDPILKQGGCAAPGEFELENLVPKVVGSCGRRFVEC